jgi:hypothetical protein
MLKQGTVSIICGVHSPIHSTLVLISWRILNQRCPRFWELVCIYLHDVGHLGKNYLDSPEEKSKHWELGAQIAGKLFGEKGFLMCAGHCAESGYPVSLLMKPDKYSWYIAPRFWLFTNTVVEPKVAMGYSKWESVKRFKASVKNSIESGEYKSSHAMYLERCEEVKNAVEKNRPQ